RRTALAPWDPCTNRRALEQCAFFLKASSARDWRRWEACAFPASPTSSSPRCNRRIAMEAKVNMKRRIGQAALDVACLMLAGLGVLVVLIALGPLMEVSSGPIPFS